MKRTKSTYLSLVTILLSPLTVNADLISVDFEDVIHGNQLINNSLTSQGFDLTHSGSFAMVNGNLGQGATDFSGNGTNRLLSFNVSSITLTESGGSVFDIFSFEGGESWVFEPHHWATQIQAVGTFLGGGTTTQLFDLDLLKDPLTGMQLFTFNDTFRNLLSVEFTGIGGNPEFSLDNLSVSVTSVPEPGTLALLGIGLVGMGLTRRRRKI